MIGPNPEQFVDAMDEFEHDERQFDDIWQAGIRTAYLAGPMRGYVNYNYPLFNAAAKRLRALGYKIENPADTDAEVQERANAAEHPLSVYMERDLADVARSDAVFVLPGWEKSQGAMIEVTVAFMLGHPVFSLPTFERVEPAFEQVPRPFPAELEAKPSNLPTGSEARKAVPITSGVLDYFPAALAAVASVSKAGNDKHNPGEPLHWARSKSMDQADAISRHLIERGGIDPETGMRYSAQLAWRALAMLQIELEEAGEAPMARGARP